jgi:dihydroneopterin aldolase
MHVVILEGLEFYAYHGVPDAEREVGHRYQVDACLGIKSHGPLGDDLSQSVDYAAVAATLIEFGTGPQCRTIERVAELMADALLDRFPLIEEAEITLRKMAPPMPHIVHAAAVRIRRTRAQESGEVVGHLDD